MIAHVLTSTRMGGIASLVLPALGELGLPVRVVFLVEERCGPEVRRSVLLARGLGLDCVEIAVRSRLDLAAVGALAGVLAAARPRVAHGHDPKASIYLLAAAWRARSPAALVSTHHGIHGRPDLRSRLYERIYARAALRRFDRVLAVSDADARELAALLGDRKVALHRNGAGGTVVDPGARPRLAAEIRRRWPLPDLAPGTLLVGVVGRLSAEKRVDRVLAVAAALPRAPTCHVVVFGDGAERAALEARAARLGLGERVTFAGYRAGVGDELAGVDVLLSLSDAEGLPVNLIEAGWAATPVLATRVGGVGELVGDAGVLVDPRAGDAAIAARLATLLGDHDERARLGRALQARVAASFSRAAWVARLREIYRPFA